MYTTLQIAQNHSELIIHQLRHLGSGRLTHPKWIIQWPRHRGSSRLTPSKLIIHHGSSRLTQSKLIIQRPRHRGTTVAVVWLTQNYLFIDHGTAVASNLCSKAAGYSAIAPKQVFHLTLIAKICSKLLRADRCEITRPISSWFIFTHLKNFHPCK